MSKAVFHNSLKCLEYILEIYDQLPDSSRSKIIWIDGNSPLFTITKKCCWAAMRIVEKHPSFIKDVVDEPGSDGSTPLLVAVKRNHIEVVKWLMNNSGMKLEIERRNRKGETAIYLAALNGQADVIKEMLERCT
jgi:ankyrin repeat protein